MAVSENLERIAVSIDRDLLAWVDEYATKFDRSRSWIFVEAVKRWQGKNQVEAARRARKRRESARKAAKSV